LIIKSYRDTTIKLAKYKKRYRDTKGVFENTKLYNARLEADIKRYTILLNRLILVLATPIQAPEVALEIDLRSYKGSLALYVLYRTPRVVILLDLTLFYRDYTIFDN
jgi:hypothetical protein